MFNMLDILSDPPMIKIIDVGAMSLEGTNEPYFQLLERGIVAVGHANFEVARFGQEIGYGTADLADTEEQYGGHRRAP